MLLTRYAQIAATQDKKKGYLVGPVLFRTFPPTWPSPPPLFLSLGIRPILCQVRRIMAKLARPAHTLHYY